MNNRKLILPKKWKSFRWYGMILFMAYCFVFLFYNNVFNLKALTVGNIAIYQANSEYRKAQWGDAEIQYKKAIAMMPDAKSAHYNLANAYYQQGRYAEALEIYVKLNTTKTNKHNTAVWMNLGNTYYKLGALENSYESFKKALLLDESNIQVRQNFLYITKLLQRRKQSQTPSKKQKEIAKKQTQKKEEDSDYKDGEKDNKKMQPGNYHFSNKEMNAMLRQNKDKVRVPQGTKSNTNQSNTNPLNY